jgi:hypothetical protein
MVPLVVRDSVPLVPVTVKGYVPAAVLAPTVRVRVEELAVVLLGLKLPVVPAGSGLSEKVTAPVKPVLVIVTA